MRTRAIGYVRVAPRERRATRLELEEQRALVTAECERRGWTLERIEEDARSGRTLRRPGLEAALAACKVGQADALVVARLDRLTYSVEHLALLSREAVEHGFNLVALDLGVDLATPKVGTSLPCSRPFRPGALESLVERSTRLPSIESEAGAAGGRRRRRPTSRSASGRSGAPAGRCRPSAMPSTPRACPRREEVRTGDRPRSGRFSAPSPRRADARRFRHDRQINH